MLVYDFKLQYHSNETKALITTFKRPGASYLIFRHAAGVVVATPFLHSPVFDSVSDTKKTKSPPCRLYGSTSMSVNYITQRCTGPRFTMHSSPMTVLRASG